MNPVLLLLLAYLIGATPTSYWVGKRVYGIDLRTKGSGNLGATNTFRVLGWRAAAPVMFVDVFKGWLPVWLFPRLETSPWWWALLYGAAAILGHVFSVWVRFRGGKGVATSAGVFLALAPWGVLVAFAVWLAVVWGTRIVSLGSVQSALVAFTVALAAFVIWAHRGNVRRLLRGEEPRFGSRGRGAEGPPDDRGGEHR